MLLLHKRLLMIELKDVTTKQKADRKGLENYSLTVQNGEFCRLGRWEGRLVIRVLVGFQTLEDGYVSFDGMPLSANSATFLRKMIAYIPSPEGFDNVDDLARKQLDMVEEALNSDSDIILAIDPVSHQTDEAAQNIMNSLRRKAAKGRVVIVATDRTDL